MKIKCSWLIVSIMLKETIMLEDQIIKEIKQIPSDKLVEIYDLIHYFRLGVTQEKNKARKLQ